MQISQQHQGKKIAEGLNGEIYFYNGTLENDQNNQKNINQSSAQINQQQQQKYVLKVFKNFLEYKNEDEALSQLSHPNIVKVLKKDKQNKQLVMKYYKNGDLFDFLQGPGQEILTEKMAKFFFKQLVLAVQYMHGQGVVHRDIKLENVLIDDDFGVILSDFGLARGGVRGVKMTEFIGTGSYMAPEIVAKQEYYGESCDIFALGVILFCLLYQNYPFQGKADPSDPHYKYFANKSHIRYWLMVEKQTKKLYSPELKQLLNQMLAYNADERITIEEILQHEWLVNDVPQQEEIQLIIDQYYRQQEEKQKMEEEEDLRVLSSNSSVHLDNKLQGKYGQDGVKQKC